MSAILAGSGSRAEKTEQSFFPVILAYYCIREAFVWNPLPVQQVLSSNMAKIYFCTVLGFCSLYAAQPIQPVFQQEFALTSL